MVMDPAAVRRLHAIGGATLIHTLATLVLEEMPARVARLEAAIRATDPAALAAAAHSLISTTGNFGAFELFELARRVELAAPAADWPALGHDAARLRELADAFLQELEQVRRDAAEPPHA
jgi:HPt (histidine-containing phosphotransfer) domain-containing protein